MCSGAPIVRHAQPEIGWYELATTAHGREDRVLGHLGERAPVFQWHSYGFDLPSGAVQLASTDTCEQQAFCYGSNAYGFQFHLEADAALIERWLRLPAYRDELAAAGIGQDEASIRNATTARLAAMQPLAEKAFNNFLDLFGTHERRELLRSSHGTG